MSAYFHQMDFVDQTEPRLVVQAFFSSRLDYTPEENACIPSLILCLIPHLILSCFCLMLHIQVFTETLDSDLKASVGGSSSERRIKRR